MTNMAVKLNVSVRMTYRSLKCFRSIVIATILTKNASSTRERVVILTQNKNAVIILLLLKLIVKLTAMTTK